MDRRALDSLIRKRGGVVPRDALRGLGMTDYMIRRAIKRGEWRPTGPSIMVHHSAPTGLVTDTRITVLWIPEAILTGMSAAVWRPHPAWQDETFTGRAMIVARRSGRGPWRTVRNPVAAGVQVNGALVGNLHTIVVDLLRFLPQRQALAIGAAAIRTGATTQQALDQSLPRFASLEAVPQLRAIVRALASGAHSAGEVDLHRALHDAGLTGWQANLPVEVFGRWFRLDVAFPAQRVYLEYDGLAPHTGTGVFVADRERQNLLSAAGWVPIRVAWEMLQDPRKRARLLAQIRATLAERATVAQSPLAGPDRCAK